MAICSYCQGSGAYPAYSGLPCPYCKGGTEPPGGTSPPPEPDAPREALSVCCGAPTFVADCRMVCSKCRLTRPME